MDLMALSKRISFRLMYSKIIMQLDIGPSGEKVSKAEGVINSLTRKRLMKMLPRAIVVQGL